MSFLFVGSSTPWMIYKSWIELSFQEPIGIFLLAVLPTKFKIFLCKETSLLSHQCLSVISWDFLKWKPKGRSSWLLLQNISFTKHYSHSVGYYCHTILQRYCFIILFSCSQNNRWLLNAYCTIFKLLCLAIRELWNSALFLRTNT